MDSNGEKVRETFSGWTAKNLRSHRHQSNDHDGSVVGPITEVEGRVVKDISTGGWGRELHLENQSTVFRVHLNAEAHELIKPWMTMKGARQLICVGASVRAKIVETEKLDEILEATSVVLTAARPTTPYLARLLVYPMDKLTLLFGNDTTAATESDLSVALSPCTPTQLNDLLRLCREEKQAGRCNLIFKRPELLELSDSIREFQGWSKSPNKPPKTSKRTWSALQRMEKMYTPVSRESKNDKESISLPEPGDCLEFNGINVDPSLNLPDTHDERRQLYVDQRKRPQVLWMLRRIAHLATGGGALNGKRPRVVTLVDVGGGRGDLANAIAAYFAQPELRQMYHVNVVVLDVNQPSLDAGMKRASDANLGSYMDFVLCDLANQEQVADVIQKHSIDFVFGLHCCGGLAEAAVELALRACAGFCISTCCFRSNEHLATLSKLAAVSGCQVIEQFELDRDRLTALAVIGGADGQPRAVQAVNALRLTAAQSRFTKIHSGGNRRLQTWQEAFPEDYSEQNGVMIGTIH